MNGNAQKLIKYMDGASKRFVIPVYQRNYDWKWNTASSSMMTWSR